MVSTDIGSPEKLLSLGVAVLDARIHHLASVPSVTLIR